MKKHLLLLFVLVIYSCINRNKDSGNIQLEVLPTFIHENDSVTVYAIKDSININTDSLFFHIDIWYQNFGYTKNYIKIQNGQGKFKVPKNAAYISGFFYNLNEMPDTKEYTRLIYDKNNKPALNAYQRKTTKEAIEKELINHPKNIAVYANQINKTSNEVYLGRASDSLLRKRTKNYLLAVQENLNLTKPSHLYTLTVLYSSIGQIDKAKFYLKKLVQNHPNSYYLVKAKVHFWFVNKFILKNNSSNELTKLSDEDVFLDSIDNYIRQKYPNSPEGIAKSSIYDYQKKYNVDNLTKNAYYRLNYADSSNLNTVNKLIAFKLRNQQYDSAEILAQRFLNLIEKGVLKHYLIGSYKRQGKEVANKYNYLAIAYTNFSEIAKLKGDWQKAINYLDTAYIELRKVDKNMMFVNFNDRLKSNQYKKAHLQRKTKQPAAALKTYSELYQELKDETILDSIKVVFEEQDQVEGFDAYVENLKNQIEGKEEELKTIPEFSIKDTEGKLYTDKNLKGAVVVLNFWGVHCSPCVREIPVMNEFWEATQGHEIVYLAITRDKALAIERFGRRQKEMFKSPIVATNQELFDTFGVQLIPTQIIINPKGEIIYTQVGATPNATQNLKKVLEKELNIDNILIE